MKICLMLDQPTNGISRQVRKFFSSDPYLASGGAGSPSSCNRFAYVGGDPVNDSIQWDWRVAFQMVSADTFAWEMTTD